MRHCPPDRPRTGRLTAWRTARAQPRAPAPPEHLDKRLRHQLSRRRSSVSTEAPELATRQGVALDILGTPGASASSTTPPIPAPCCASSPTACSSCATSSGCRCCTCGGSGCTAHTSRSPCDRSPTPPSGWTTSPRTPPCWPARCPRPPRSRTCTCAGPSSWPAGSAPNRPSCRYIRRGTPTSASHPRWRVGHPHCCWPATRSSAGYWSRPCTACAWRPYSRPGTRRGCSARWPPATRTGSVSAHCPTAHTPRRSARRSGRRSTCAPPSPAGSPVTWRSSGPRWRARTSRTPRSWRR